MNIADWLFAGWFVFASVYTLVDLYRRSEDRRESRRRNQAHPWRRGRD